MRNITNYRIALRILGLALLSLTLWGLYTRPIRTQQGDRLIPVTITKQLEPVNGIVPAKIQCGTAHLSAPNALERFSCSLKNNSTLSITAANAIYSVILERSGATFKDTHNSTVDALVHADFKQSNKLILPGDKTEIGPPGPISYGDAIVIGIEIEIDYVEFEDGTASGPDQQGSHLIRAIREGAAKYKEWLRHQYKRNGKVDEAVLPLLKSDQPLPQDLNLNEGEMTGAKTYRRDLLKLHEKLGRHETERRLN